MKRSLANLYRKASAGQLPLSNTWWAQRLLNGIHLAVIVVQQTAGDRLHVRSATLAYWTAVGAVPLLVLAFALTGQLGLAEATVEGVRGLLYDTVLSDSVGAEITAVIEQMLGQVDLGTVGGVGVLGLMGITSQIYFQVELAVNDIFSTRLNRSWFWRFALFNLSVLVAPLIVATGIVLSAAMPEGTTTFTFVVPWLMTSLAFVLAIKYLPNTPVRWRSAIIGGLVSAALFEGAKRGFTLYTDLLGTRDSMARLYGSVAFVPVFLIWLNFVWLVVLMGVELSYVIDKGSQLLDVQRERAADPYALRRRPDGLFAVGVLLALYEAGAEDSASVTEIAERAGVPRHHTVDALEVLEDAGVVEKSNQGRWRAIHAPEDISAGEVLRAWQSLAAPQWMNAGLGQQLVAGMQLKLEHSANISMAKLMAEVQA
jgi:membrane protein